MYVFVIVHFWQVSHLGNHLTLLGFCNPNEACRLQRISQKRARKELPHVGGQGQKPGGPHARGEAAKRSYSTPEARGRGLEDLPHLQGVVAARAQESLEELFHVQGQKGQW